MIDAHGRWTPSTALEVGDRVRHIVKDTYGFVEKVDGETLTVNIAGESVVVCEYGVAYAPTKERIERDKKLIRKSWKDKGLRAELGLPRYTGPDL